MERLVQCRPCSVADLFLSGCLTSDDILPGGQISDETRLRAERNYAEQADRQTRGGVPRRPATARASTASHVDRVRVRRLQRAPTPSESVSARTSDRIVPTEPTPSLGNCAVCLTRAKAYACVPCYHLCVCSVCKERVTECPLCRASAREVVRIFW
jgi:hypothetical protein